MSLITNEKIVLVSPSHGGVEVETFSSKLDMVLKLMQSSGINRVPDYYGGPGHTSALDEIEKHLTLVRQEIEEDHLREANTNEP